MAKKKTSGPKTYDGVTVGFWLTRELYEALRSKADSERRAVSQYVRMLVEDALAAGERK